MKASTYWRILTVIFAAFTIVVSLGAWVFHWWSDPGQWLAAVGLLLTLAAMGVSATSGQVERLAGTQRQGFDKLGTQMQQGFDKLAQVQEEQTRILTGMLEEQTRIQREMLESFRAREQPRAHAWARSRRIR